MSRKLACPANIVIMSLVGAAISTLFMGTAYYLVVTPVGLIVKLVRDPLRREWDARAASYWDELHRGQSAHELADRRDGGTRPHWL